MVSQLERERVEELTSKTNERVYSTPCQVTCPLGVDIQRSHVLLSQLSFDNEEASRQISKIGERLYEKNPLFPIDGYICGLCKQGRNYKKRNWGSKATAATAKRYLKDPAKKPHSLYATERKPPSEMNFSASAVVYVLPPVPRKW